MSSGIKQLLLVSAALLCAHPCLGKGTTVQLTIAGPDLEQPVHTEESLAISASVWGGNFVDWDSGPLSWPVDTLPRYLVHFWVRLPDNSVQMKYVVWYSWDPGQRHAIVCLPGPRDLWYRINVFSILRQGQDGNCYRAADHWGRAIQSALRR